IEKRFGSLTGDARVRAEEDFARAVSESKSFASAETVNKLFDMSAAQLRDLHDPLIDFNMELNALAADGDLRTQQFNAAVGSARPILLRGMSEMRGGKLYPDANRTLRFSYGSVK